MKVEDLIPYYIEYPGADPIRTSSLLKYFNSYRTDLNAWTSFFKAAEFYVVNENVIKVIDANGGQLWLVFREYSKTRPDLARWFLSTVEPKESDNFGITRESWVRTMHPRVKKLMADYWDLPDAIPEAAQDLQKLFNTWDPHENTEWMINGPREIETSDPTYPFLLYTRVSSTTKPCWIFARYPLLTDEDSDKDFGITRESSKENCLSSLSEESGLLRDRSKEIKTMAINRFSIKEFFEPQLKEGPRDPAFKPPVEVEPPIGDEPPAPGGAVAVAADQDPMLTQDTATEDAVDMRFFVDNAEMMPSELMEFVPGLTTLAEVLDNFAFEIYSQIQDPQARINFKTDYQKMAADWSKSESSFLQKVTDLKKHMQVV